ncbi:MAG: carboxymuconolactone decarboxylase family protein, partial [Bacteroidia bacterium]|nr:carboxymuconolactone decarboxylase family protein [Bacteroidia bacterium]MDW8335190.1 carboxymuconolactone decarboxylase family protein [Bacteroidia bacterium]
MAYISLPPEQPGIRGPMVAYPVCGAALNRIAEAVLTSDLGLARWERELIATYVSFRNQCRFCYLSHKAFAQALADENIKRAIDAFFADGNDAAFRPILRALLKVADLVRLKADTREAIEYARLCGADDATIHDAVLIAAAFCMFNRYVDGLGTECPPEG